MLSAEINDSIEALREKCPAKHPVVVVVGRGIPKDSHATADLVVRGRRQYFVIRLPRFLAMQKIFLVHEWAHCVSWGMDVEEHGDHFGLEYARAYRTAFREGR